MALFEGKKGVNFEGSEIGGGGSGPIGPPYPLRPGLRYTV